MLKGFWINVLALLSGLGVSACQSTSAGKHETVPAAATVLLQPQRTYATQNVVVVVIDGVRYTESWGDSTHRHIRHMARELAPKGVFHPAFYNKGVTLTNPGHVALMTGNYQRLSNRGREVPEAPSVFHYYRQHTGAPAHKAWIITSKDKLEILARTTSEEPAAAFAPSVDCGVEGLGSGYRDDTTTLRVAKQILAKHTPHAVLLNLKGPDSEAHEGDWSGYLDAIEETDQMVADLWKWLQKHPSYRNTTTLLVTNDHGRHTGERFQNHGDGCEGCRHISLLVLGPDVEPGTVATKPRSQADIAPTIAELLGVPIPKLDGEPMLELFEGASGVQ
ncbi:sulfatase-like hydrolase/transferase [Rufibacter psychrotolerans]|uniref:sulfatase-like hydrolase/transferase n=1 Tax=Rufibacter psychrotolerans TaxID=2812556 RepID=UPI001968866E|nr:sulfatase-like hydrolase/transferase [Rufibacter sp. SYSU D00308]